MRSTIQGAQFVFIATLLAYTLPACVQYHEEGAGCTNTCRFASDGDCDDGGEGSDFSLCDLGTDCNDCGPRGSGPGGSGSDFRLTCYDGRAGAEQCVHYTFPTAAARDSFYDRCEGLTSRTRDAHNCRGGEVGDGFCRHMAGTTRSDTFTYIGTASELRARCSSTEGVWMSR